MKQLTDKQRQFVANKAAGVANRDAAIAAGYAVAGAEVAAGKLMKNPAVRAAIKAATEPVHTKAEKPTVRMLPKYQSSLALLQHTYNNPKMPDAMRIRAAEQALPYEHAKMGEQGKKEKAKERAREVASRKRGQFAPKQAPQLHLVKTVD